MDPIVMPEPSAEPPRSRQSAHEARLRRFFAERFDRLERLEAQVQRGPASPEARFRLELLRRAKFSTWLDLQALEDGEPMPV